VDIEVLTVDGCPHRTETVARLRVALAVLGTVAVVNERVIASAADAAAAGMHGSPTVLIDGRDLFTVQSVEPSWSCRLYPRPAGMDGAPGLDALMAALAGRAGSSGRHGCHRDPGRAGGRGSRRHLVPNLWHRAARHAAPRRTR
jgi:hypothetical protein